MAKLTVKNGIATLSNNENSHKFMIKDHDLSDFKWYKNVRDGKYYLATYVTDKNERKISKHCGLFDLNDHGCIFPKIKGFLMGNTDEWYILKVDNRSFNRLISLDCMSSSAFKQLYKPTNSRK